MWEFIGIRLVFFLVCLGFVFCFFVGLRKRVLLFVCLVCRYVMYISNKSGVSDILFFSFSLPWFCSNIRYDITG